MHTYNKIMIYFWLTTSIILFIIITYLGITEGFKSWAPYYVAAFLAFFMYFMRKWMMKRADKHMQYLEEQEKAKK